MNYFGNTPNLQASPSTSYSMARPYVGRPYTDRDNSSFTPNNVLPDAYTPRSNPMVQNFDLSRALRFDAYLLAIIRIDDKRNALYSADVVSKLRQKEQTKSFINKPCTLFVTDRHLIIFDRVSKVIAETNPLEIVDPTCVHSDAPDTLNDIFMYRILDRQIPLSSNQSSSSQSGDAFSVIVFKCSNNEAKALVDSIRNATVQTSRNLRSEHVDMRVPLETRVTDIYGGATTFVSPRTLEPTFSNPPYTLNHRTTETTVTQQSTQAATDYYKRLTEELNKCFDDIELFVRYLEAVVEYTKGLERDHRRKPKKSSAGVKPMADELPAERFFIDVLQKFKHSFNLLGELKHIIHNPNAPELIAHDVRTPALTRDAKELLLNCLTSKESEILRNLGPSWMRTLDDATAKFSDYRPVFFNGHAAWVENSPTSNPQLIAAQVNEQTKVTHPFTTFDEGQSLVVPYVRPPNPDNHSNGAGPTHITVVTHPLPQSARQFDSSTIDRSVNHEAVNPQIVSLRQEDTWAIERRLAGAKICTVKVDRKGQNRKELSVRRGELLEIEDTRKQWWRARNFHGEVGHVPYNIVEEVDIERRLN